MSLPAHPLIFIIAVELSCAHHLLSCCLLVRLCAQTRMHCSWVALWLHKLNEMGFMQEDEFLVVSTDGLWDVMPPKEAMLYARKELLRGKRPQEVRLHVQVLIL